MSIDAVETWLRRTGKPRFAAIVACFALGAAWLMFVLWGLALPLAGGALTNATGAVAGGDAATFHAAGRFVVDGRAAHAYDPQAQGAAYVALGGRLRDGRAYWAYPPPALLALAPLGLLEPRGGILAWLAAMGLASIAAVAVAARDWRAALPAIFVPTAVHGVAVGQNGGLTALILALAFVWRDRRPMLAGASLGLLALKPQLGLAAGMWWLARRRFAALAVAVLVAAVLALTATVVLGWGIWPAFLDAARLSTEALAAFELRTDRLTTAYGLALTLGAPRSIAGMAQAVTAGMAIALLLQASRPGADEVAASLALAAATVLVTPYAFEYDFVVFVLPLGILFARWLGGAPADVWDVAVFAYAMLVGPAVGVTYALLGIQPGVFVVLGGLLLACALARARSAP